MRVINLSNDTLGKRANLSLKLTPVGNDKERQCYDREFPLTERAGHERGCALMPKVWLLCLPLSRPDGTGRNSVVGFDQRERPATSARLARWRDALVRVHSYVRNGSPDSLTY